VAVGDFNGDGRLDLATTNADSGTASVLLGDGAGGFGAATSYSVGSFPAAVAVGDFNGDGRPDLAVTHNFNDSMSVLLGDGAGGFGPATPYPVDVQLFKPAGADFNGDGYPDQVVANRLNDSVSVLLGDGAGGFGAPTPYPAGPGPAGWAVGDFNGDGRPDLAVALHGASSVGVLLNAPGGTAVSVAGGTPLTALEGQRPVVATFTDPSGPGYLGDYSATIASDSGQTLPGVITFDPRTNVFSVAADCQEEGTYQTVTVRKKGSPAPPAVVRRQLTVADAPAVVSGGYLAATEAAPFAGLVAVFTDPGHGTAGDFTATVAWGDGSSSAGTVTPSGSGFNVSGSHTYAVAGSYVATVAVLDAGGASAGATTTFAVADAPLTAVGKTAGFAEGAPGSAVVAFFTDPDPHVGAGLYAATIDWGDGTPRTAGTVSPDGSGFDVTGSHTYATHGTYPVTVTITDSGGASATATAAAAVDYTALQGTPQAISVAGNKRFSGVVATFTDPDPRVDPVRYQAAITWPDDGTTSAGVITGTNPFKVKGTHTFPSFAGTLTIKVVLTDLDTPGRTLTVLSRVADPPAAVMQQQYVTQLYQDLLQRPPDDSGLAYWTGLLEQGASRQQVAAGITGSMEYLQLEVRQLYRGLLDRAADPGGLGAFTALLQGGGTVEQVAALITGSPEYSQARGGGTADGFLGALYTDALGRGADPTGQAVFGGALARGATREDVAAAVFGSAEYRGDLVEGAYQRFLHRGSDAGGRAAFLDALGQGLRDEALAAMFTASDEYFANLGLPPGS
jgi:hypothetical protein